VQPLGVPSVPARIQVKTDGERVTFVVAPAGVAGGRLLLAVGLIGCALLCAMAIVIGLQGKVASGLRTVGMASILLAGFCLLAICTWEALKVARARALVTLDGDTLTVQEFDLRKGPMHRWRKPELKSLAAGFNIVSVRSVDPCAPAARGTERVLWVELVTGDKVPVLGPCELGEELPWLAITLSAHLRIPCFDLPQNWLNPVPVGRPANELEVPLRVSAATAMNGGRVTTSIRRKSGAEQQVDIVLPPGIQDGKRLRLRGLGGGGEDLIIRVEVARPAAPAAARDRPRD